MATAWRLEHEEVIDEVRALGLLIRETESGLIAFGVVRGVAEREAAVRALKERVPLPFKEFALSAAQRDPVRLLLGVPGKERTCVLFYDLESALPDAAGFLNLQRERFGELSHAVVFWVGEDGLRQVATHAPDLWAWRSGVFDFRSEQYQRPLAGMSAALDEPMVYRDKGDLERRISLYRGLIDEHGQEKEPDIGYLARMETRLGQVLFDVGRLGEAEERAAQALDHGRSAGHREAQAGALDLMGAVAGEAGRVVEAEGRFQSSLAIRRDIGDEEDVGVSFHYLGIIAGKRGRLDEAEEWYRKALEVFERLGLERDAAGTYHNLGITAGERLRLDEAEEWYRKALEVFERLGLDRDVAGDYYQLGRVAEDRHRLDEAEEWYRKALEVYERLGLERNVAEMHHHLGNVAYLRERPDEAVEWYGNALEVFERLGLERHAAGTYHNLGNIAQKRWRLDEAEEWYCKALEVFERLGHRPDMVDTLEELGVLRHRQDRPGEAVSWSGRALDIATEHKMGVATRLMEDLAWLVRHMGETEFTAAWEQAFDGRQPPLEALREAMPKLEEPQATESTESGEQPA